MKITISDVREDFKAWCRDQELDIYLDHHHIIEKYPEDWEAYLDALKDGGYQIVKDEDC